MPLFLLVALVSHAHGQTENEQDIGGRSRDLVVEQRYSEILRRERMNMRSQDLTERMVSGSAALVIGFYGYFFDERGILGRAVYSATQTAGIVMISNAVRDANSSSLILTTDSWLKRQRNLDLPTFKRSVVEHEEKQTLATTKQLAYTSAILAALYGFNGYRERDSSLGLQNVFYFLSFNFSLISAANFYRLATFEPLVGTSRETSWLSESVEVALFPHPSVTLYF